MTRAEIRKLHEARPFLPFVIHTADGRRIRVDHPEFMASSPPARILVVFQPDGSFDLIDILLITTVHVGKNGARPRPRKK